MYLESSAKILISNEGNYMIRKWQSSRDVIIPYTNLNVAVVWVVRYDAV